MAKLIYISGSPVSKIVGEKLCIDYYIDNGFEVEFWNLTSFYYSEKSLSIYFGGHSDFRFEFPCEKKFSTRSKVKEALKASENNSIYCFMDFNIHNDYWLMRFFKKYNILYYVGPKRTSERFAWQSGKGLSLSAFLFKAISVIKNRVNITYIKKKIYSFIYNWTDYYKKPLFVIGSGTLGRIEWLNFTRASHFVSVPSNDLLYEKLPNLINASYCVYIDDAVVYSPDQSMLKNKHSTCNNLADYSRNICNVFDLIEKTLDCKVVIATSGKFKYADSKIFGEREIFYGKSNQLVQHATIVLGHASSATWQVIVSLKPILLLWDPSFIKAKNVGVTLQSAFLGVTPKVTTELTSEDIKQIQVNQKHYLTLIEKYFCEKNLHGSIEKITLKEMREFLNLKLDVNLIS